MPRANRHYIPGCIWHITQRCHKREFLLKFHYCRQRWLFWMYEAKKRFDISILDYIVTSNHIHLLAMSKAKENDIEFTTWPFSTKVQ
ncbi:MAG: transposase [Candidatus Saccharicenans sp.]